MFGEEDGDIDDVVPTRARIFQHEPDVFENGAGLDFDVVARRCCPRCRGSRRGFPCCRGRADRSRKGRRDCRHVSRAGTRRPVPARGSFRRFHSYGSHCPAHRLTSGDRAHDEKWFRSRWRSAPATRYPADRGRHLRSQAKNRTNGRRLMRSMVANRSAQHRILCLRSRRATARWRHRSVALRAALHRPRAPACADDAEEPRGSWQRLHFDRKHRRQIAHDRIPGVAAVGASINLAAGRAEINSARV